MWIYGLLVVFMGLWSQTGGQCSFPQLWRGRWYQSGLGEVVIHEHRITKKGVCREHYRDYYLVENRDEGCFQCLLMMKRHDNIIQYKESYCLSGETLQDICTQIRVEAILYTLVREPALPVQCPFQGAYHFSYNNNTGGFCRSPTSYVKGCASDAKFQFQFENCPDAAYTHQKELDFECLATWKDGSTMYMYGGFSGSGIIEKGDIYRCFMFEVLGTVVYLAMSADATCRGLRSSRDGPLVMEFTKDNRWPRPACEYPVWLTRTPWQDLSGKHVYSFDVLGQIMTSSYKRHPDATPHIRSAFRCMNIMAPNTTESQLVAISFTSHECESKYQCIRIVKRRTNVLEIHKGAYVGSSRGYCHESHMSEASKHVLIPLGLKGTRCPFSGTYYLQPEESQCQIDVRSGCNRSSQIEIVSSCVAKPIGQLECLETWIENDKNYIIARRLGDSSSVANCFSFQHSGDTLEFSTDRRCNKGAPNIYEDDLRYTLNAKPGDCDELKKTTWLDMTTKDQARPRYTTANKGKHNEGYRHTKTTRDDYHEVSAESHDYYSGRAHHVQVTCTVHVISVIALAIFSR